MEYEWRPYKVIEGVQIYIDDTTPGGPFFVIDGGEVRTREEDAISDARMKGYKPGDDDPPAAAPAVKPRPRGPRH